MDREIGAEVTPKLIIWGAVISQMTRMNTALFDWKETMNLRNPARAQSNTNQRACQNWTKWKPARIFLTKNVAKVSATSSEGFLPTVSITEPSKAIIDIRLRPLSGAAPGGSVWVYGDTSMPLPIESLLQRLFLAIVYKHDVIHKTGST